MSKLLIFSIITMLLHGCSSSPHHMSKNSDHICEKKMEERGFVKKLLDKSLQGVKTTASYVLTGATYTGQMIVSFGGGVALGLVVCSPLLALDVAAKNENSLISGECIAKVSGSIIGTLAKENLGKKTYIKTSSWRCPEVDYISESLRSVATCYKDRGDNDKALLQLKNIQNDSIFNKCLSIIEKSIVELEIQKF